MEVIYDNKTGTQVLQLEKDCFYHDIAKNVGRRTEPKWTSYCFLQ